MCVAQAVSADSEVTEEEIRENENLREVLQRFYLDARQRSKSKQQQRNVDKRHNMNMWDGKQWTASLELGRASDCLPPRRWCLA